MKLRLIIITVVSLILLTSCTAKQTADSNPSKQVSSVSKNQEESGNKQSELENLESLFADMESRGMFSGTVLIARDDSILLNKAYGYSAKNVPMKTDTKLNIGSIGKSFTAVAICQLAQAGKLSYDDTVEKYIPELAPLSKGQMTIRNLLNHTSGLGNFFEAPGYMENKDKITKVREMLPYITYEPLKFKPGERFSYSNSGYIVLGLIVEAVSGQDYYTYVNENIFKPAGMTSTGFYAKTDNIPNLAIGFMGENREDNTDELPLMGSPAGGAYSTTGDMLRFVNALKDGTLLYNAFDELINKAISPNSNNYGFGMSRFPVGKGLVVGHNGGFPGVSAHYETYLDTGYTVVVLSNFDDAALEVIDAIRREIATPGAPSLMQAPDMSNASIGSITIDGKQIAVRVEPVEIDGVLYAPVDDISKAMGATIRRTPDEGNIDVNGLKIHISVGSESVIVNGQEKMLPAPVISIEPCLMAPVQFFEIVYGYSVNTDAGLINITTKP